MKVGDIVKIRNQCGILEVKLVKELTLDEINKGTPECMTIHGKARLEIHKNDSGTLITLCERDAKNMVIVFLGNWEESSSCFYGEFDTEVNDVCFETIYE